MNHLAKFIVDYYMQDSEVWDNFIQKRLDKHPGNVGYNFGQLLAERYTELRNGISERADRWAVLELGHNLFIDLDTETSEQVGQALLEDYKKRQEAT